MKTQMNQKGFTLIELLIVIAIIGILAAVAVPSYQNYIRSSTANAHAENFNIGFRLAQNELGKYAANHRASGRLSRQINIIAELNKGGKLAPGSSTLPAFTLDAPAAGQVRVSGPGINGTGQIIGTVTVTMGAAASGTDALDYPAAIQPNDFTNTTTVD